MTEDELKPSRNLFILLAAVLIPVIAVAAYVVINRVPNPHTGQVLSVNVYPIHRDLTQTTTTEGIGGQNETYDEILLLTDVSITNTAKVPLYLHDMWANVNLPDESDRSSAASATDFDKVFIAYPDLAQYKKNPLPRDLTLQPGQQVEGMMIFHYQMNKQQWDSRSGVDVNISFIHQPPLVLHIAK